MGQTTLLHEAGTGQRHSCYSEGVEPEGARLKIRTSYFSSVIISLRTLFLKILSFQRSPQHLQGLSYGKAFPTSPLDKFRVGGINKMINHGSYNV